LKVRAIFLAVLLLGASFVLSFEKVKSLSMAAEGISKVEIDCGAGFLKVTGDETLKSIEVRAGIIVSGKSEDKAQEYIDKNIEGDVAVDDGSGEIDALDITGNVDVDDGSGSIHLVNIGQNVVLSDGSGSIDIDGVEGDVIIKDDGSGGVSINNVKGKIIK